MSEQIERITGPRGYSILVRPEERHAECNGERIDALLLGTLSSTEGGPRTIQVDLFGHQEALQAIYKHLRSDKIGQRPPRFPQQFLSAWLITMGLLGTGWLVWWVIRWVF